MRVEKDIFLEEIERATTNSGRNQTKKKCNEERPRKEASMRVRRYHVYTPLNISLTDIYKEVRQVERFPKPKFSTQWLVSIGHYFASITTISSIRRRIATTSKM